MFKAPAIRRTAAWLAVAALFSLSAHEASARSWSRTGWGGRTWSGTATHYNNGGGAFGRTVTETGPSGRTATESFNRSVNNGVITDSRSYTGYGGRTATETLTRTPGQGGTATYSGRAGATYTTTFGP